MPMIDWLAVLAATIASFAVGAVWYSPLLFVKPWQRQTGRHRRRRRAARTWR